jgi:hypothetical protein
MERSSAKIVSMAPGDGERRAPLDLRRVSDRRLVTEGMDAFDRFYLAEHAWEEFTNSSEQDPERGYLLAEVLAAAHADWLAIFEEQIRRRGWAS